MTLILQRTHEVEDTTFGKLYLNDMTFLNYTLEDKVREVKIKHQTAIPAGTYQIIINKSERFKQFLPLLLNVPGFDGIRIHKGNYADLEIFLKEIPLSKNVITDKKIRYEVTKENQKSLLSKYGIVLDLGSYTIENTGLTYKICILKDDTSGCILVGDRITSNSILFSTTAFQRLYDLLYNKLKTEKVYIRIEDIPKPLPVVPKPVELPKEIILPTVEVTVVKPVEVITQPPIKEKQNWLQTLINILKWITKL